VQSIHDRGTAPLEHLLHRVTLARHDLADVRRQLRLHRCRTQHLLRPAVTDCRSHHQCGRRQRLHFELRPRPCGDTVVNAHESPELLVDEDRHRRDRQDPEHLESLAYAVG
jgi:hypothetical protein